MPKLGPYSKTVTAVIGQALAYASLYYGTNHWVSAAVAVAAAARQIRRDAVVIHARMLHLQGRFGLIVVRCCRSRPRAATLVYRVDGGGRTAVVLQRKAR